MAVYRQIHVSFWTDDFILELTPEEKFFYMYLLTSSKSTQCGIYKISMKIMEFETGYNRDTVEKLIKKFIDYGKILYSQDTKELMILNWFKYNFINSRNTITCINRELALVKNKEFLKKMYEICISNDYPVNEIFNGIDMKDIIIEGEKLPSSEAPCKPLKRDSEGACKPIGEEEEKEEIKKETEIEENEEELKKVISVFNNNIHPVTPIECEKLRDWCSNVEPEVVVIAINEAVENSARSMRYINRVLNNWLQLGLNTVLKVNSYNRDWKDKNSKRSRNNKNSEQHRNGGNSEQKEKVPNAAAYRYVEVENGQE